MTVKSKNHQKRGRGARRAFLFVLLFACLGGAGYLAYLGASELVNQREGDGFYASLAVQAEDGLISDQTDVPDGANSDEMAVHQNSATEQSSSTSALDLNGSLKSYAGAPSEIDFDALRKTCPDIVGWLRIDDTVIDYPIVQGEDNDFYLYHLADGTPNRNGSIMMDQANDGLFGNAVNILHGHHMRSGSMFGRLADYKEEAYYQAHSIIRLYTPGGDYDVAVFAAYTVDGYTYGYPTAFADEAEFDVFIRRAVSATPYETDVTVSYGDRLLMLSTCAYSYEGARFVVLGKIIEPESAQE